MPYKLHPDIEAVFAKLFPDGPPSPLPVGDIANRRERLNGLFNTLNDLAPSITDVQTQDFFAKADDGTDILCRWFTKQHAKLPGSAVLYAHGGGMIALALKDYDKIVKRYVSRTGVPFLAVEYRYAPEFPAPIPVKDVYAGLKYLHEHASERGIDPNRIAIAGDSGGGGVAASLAHYVNQNGGPKICKQVLIYPMLDDRVDSVDPDLAPYLAHGVDDNLTGWGALLGERRGKEGVPPTDAAGRMTVEQARGLPPAYIEVGELDLFCKENIRYVSTLTDAGVATEFHLLPHLTHAAQDFIPESDFGRATFEWRCAVFSGL